MSNPSAKPAIRLRGVRHNNLKNFDLDLPLNQLIVITGLSGSAQAGQAFTFQMTGDLTIRNVTQSVTFNVTAQGSSTAQITGTATAQVNRNDFNLSIPSVPNVANVGNEVTLQIDFVAHAEG